LGKGLDSVKGFKNVFKSYVLDLELVLREEWRNQRVLGRAKGAVSKRTISNRDENI
jgi:hypothetical protein